MLIAVNYHYVRPAFAAHGRGAQGVTPSELARQIELLARVGSIVSADQVRRAVLGLGALPERAVLVTFDDGLREQYEFALPVLARLGVPAVFFVNTLPIASGTVCSVHKIHLLLSHLEPAELEAMLQRVARSLGLGAELRVGDDEPAAHYLYDTPQVARIKYLLNLVLGPAERDRLVGECFVELFGDEAEVSAGLYMEPAQVVALAEADFLGSHGHAHQPTGLLAPGEMERDVASSFACLEQWTGQRPYAFSYPYGSRDACSREAALAVAGEGGVFALTMERAGNRDVDAPYHLARFSCNDLPGGRSPRYALDTLFDEVPGATWCRTPEMRDAGAARRAAHR
ncbi:MAG TPA: polysaccharide deacetylase family protein [Gemmatimonadales bacterium]